MASFPQPNLITNLAAGVDLSSSQYKALILSADGEVDPAGAAASTIGFLMNSPTAGSVAEIATNGGGGKAIAGGTITAGDSLATDANGDVVVATGVDSIVGIALEDAVDNDVFGILVYQPVSTVAGVQELTASGAVTAGIQSVELNHISVVIAATIAASTGHPGLFVVKDTSASGTAAHTLTLTAGTFDGTNTIATLNAPNEALVVYFDSAGNGTIVENVGTVVLS